MRYHIITLITSFWSQNDFFNDFFHDVLCAGFGNVSPSISP
jgi:hypothetical protein